MAMSSSGLSSAATERMLMGLLRALAVQAAKALDRDLTFIEWQTTSFAREHEKFFAELDRPRSGEGAELCEAPDGSRSLYQTNLRDGSSFFVPRNSVPLLGEEQRRFAARSVELNPLYRNAYEATPYVVAVYFNTDVPADMNRYYPFLEKPWEVYPADLSMGDFNFFYLADEEHNPERKTVWTGVYLDPAGQGWMLSCIAPVYRGDTLKGVAGLDVTFSKMVESIVNLGLPWGAACLLVAPDGRILAATEQAQRLVGVRELPKHIYAGPISEEMIDPEELKLASIPDKALRAALESFLSSDESLREVELPEGALLLAQATVPSTGWRLCVASRRSDLLAEIDRLAGRESELQSELEAKETELAYTRWLFSLASGYLHNVGNAVTRMESPLIDLKNVIKYSAQYPEIFYRIKQGGAAGEAILRRFEEVLVGEIVPSLKNVAGSIADIKEVIRDSISHQQAGFKAAVRQVSEQIDLSALLLNLCALLRKEHPALECEIAAGVTVRGFRIQLWQGLDNVIRNAIQVSAPHEMIRVTCEGTADGAVVTVQDQGKGIAPEDLPHITKAGYTTREDGHGLGLHSLAVFLSASGGLLEVDSPGLGRGTTVKVTIRNEK
jgi:signal transduction histidine kinase